MNIAIYLKQREYSNPKIIYNLNSKLSTLFCINNSKLKVYYNLYNNNLLLEKKEITHKLQVLGSGNELYVLGNVFIDKLNENLNISYYIIEIIYIYDNDIQVYETIMEIIKKEDIFKPLIDVDHIDFYDNKLYLDLPVNLLKHKNNNNYEFLYLFFSLLICFTIIHFNHI
jgi:hypothetical protein